MCYKMIKHWIKANIPAVYAIKSYSQEGEDMILRRIFREQSTGFYIDIGAHHPWRFSNTYYFYRKGWCGINIDAMPGSMKPFMKARPRDINLEVPIAQEKKQAEFFCFNDPALNTFDPIRAQQIEQDTPFRLTQTLSLNTQRLEALLHQHLPANQDIDFMSVDAEGHDMAVLLSNDWRRFIPRVVLVEQFTHNLMAMDSPMHQFLLKNDYLLFASAYNSKIYIHTDSGLTPNDATA